MIYPLYQFLVLAKPTAFSTEVRTADQCAVADAENVHQYFLGVGGGDFGTRAVATLVSIGRVCRNLVRHGQGVRCGAIAAARGTVGTGASRPLDCDRFNQSRTWLEVAPKTHGLRDERQGETAVFLHPSNGIIGAVCLASGQKHLGYADHQ
ncbi:hypothetical protein D9M70_439870 [compost metagenome]